MIVSESKYDASILCGLFESLFAESHRTQLLGGATEPLYQPAASDNHRHTIYFNRDFFASALHEVAHWCIAGEQRRQQIDYGYWYWPDGRDAAQQQLFEGVEIKPQALEWMFSVAAGWHFRISADNLNGDTAIKPSFRHAIWQQTQTYCCTGMPSRAEKFATALRDYFSGQDFLHSHHYKLATLG